MVRGVEHWFRNTPSCEDLLVLRLATMGELLGVCPAKTMSALSSQQIPYALSPDPQSSEECTDWKAGGARHARHHSVTSCDSGSIGKVFFPKVDREMVGREKCPEAQLAVRPTTRPTQHMCLSFLNVWIIIRVMKSQPLPCSGMSVSDMVQASNVAVWHSDIQRCQGRAEASAWASQVVAACHDLSPPSPPGGAGVVLLWSTEWNGAGIVRM